jgi:argininosuccinate synthase
MQQRIVLACDGVDAAGAIAWLASRHEADVVTLTLDTGDGTPLDGTRDLLLGSGAVRAHVLDVQEEFARDIVIPAARGATTGGRESRAALARPLLARKLVDIARIERASAVAYVPLAAGRDPLGALVRELEPSMTVIPIDSLTGVRESASRRRPLVTSSPAHVEIAFANGVPVTLNGITMRLPELIDSLATIAAEHGIGQGEHAVMPAITVLRAAYEALAASDGTVSLKLANGALELEERSTTVEHRL